MSRLLDALRARGWKIAPTTSPGQLLPPDVATRYGGLPPDVVEFLGQFDICCSADETAWFLTAADFVRTPGGGFRWNEYEMMAVDAAEGDVALVREVNAFWDRHFPLMLAVHSDYDYLALCLDDGSVVHGCAPEWENPSRIAGSFVEFVHMFEAQAAGDAQLPLKLFLGAG